MLDLAGHYVGSSDDLMTSQTLVIAAVGALGIGAQWIAWRTGWPAIVLMSAAALFAVKIHKQSDLDIS